MASRDQRGSKMDLGLYLLLVVGVLVVLAIGFAPYSAAPLVLLLLASLLVGGLVWAGTRTVKAFRSLSTPEARMREEQMSLRIGRVEIGLIIGAALVLTIEAVALANDLGPFVALVSLGYFLAAGAAYLVYRNLRAQGLAEGGPQPAAAASVGTAADYAVVRQSDLLRTLTDAQASRVRGIGRWERIPAGTRLAEAGARADSIYAIAEGQMELTARSKVGESTIRVAGPGEVLPLAALLGDGILVTSVATMTDVTALVLPRDRLLALCAEEPDIGRRVFSTIAEILANRYRATLAQRMTGISEVLKRAELWANM